MEKELQKFKIGTLQGLGEFFASKGAIRLGEKGEWFILLGNGGECRYAKLQELLDRRLLNKKIEGAGNFGIKNANKQDVKKEIVSQANTGEKQTNTEVKKD